MKKIHVIGHGFDLGVDYFEINDTDESHTKTRQSATRRKERKQRLLQIFRVINVFQHISAKLYQAVRAFKATGLRLGRCR